MLSSSKADGATSDTSPLIMASVPLVAERIEQVLAKARLDMRSQDLDQFLDRDNPSGISQLYTIMTAYADCFQNANVTSKRQLERLWADNSNHPNIKKAIDNLREAEVQFEDFVAEIEIELRKKESQFDVKGSALTGQALSKDLTLIDATSKKVTTLEGCWKDSSFTLFVLLRHFG